MNNEQLIQHKLQNLDAMNTLCNIRCGIEFEKTIQSLGGCQCYLDLCGELEEVPQSIECGIDALYTKNQIVEAIEQLKASECFLTDTRVIISLLESLLVVPQAKYQEA